MDPIFTYVGTRADTIYSRTNGRWSAIPAGDKRPIDSITLGISEVKDVMAKAALPRVVDPDILTYAALEIAIEGIMDQVDNMYLDLDAGDLVANEMFANVFAFLDADDRKREQILIMLGEAKGTFLPRFGKYPSRWPFWEFGENGCARRWGGRILEKTGSSALLNAPFSASTPRCDRIVR